MIRVLSLGAGVQSSTVLLMSYHGDLPLLDAAIFADTQWEPAEVYRHLEWLKQEVNHKIPIHVVSVGSLRADALKSKVRGVKADANHWASMPFYVKGSLREGMIRRQCTSEYKIQPIDRFIRQKFLGLKLGQRNPKTARVEQWFGISIDEISRLRTSSDSWKTYEYPLCGMPHEYLSRRYSRQDCLEWFSKRYPDRTLPRSACIGCPFHSDAEWREIKSHPDQWADAVEFDHKMRNCRGMRGQIFLHRSLVPLDQVDLRTPEDRGQINFFNNECSGHCGV